MIERSLSLHRSALVWAMLLGSVSAAERSVEGSLEAFVGEPRMEMQQLFKDERFPNIVVTVDGERRVSIASER